MSARAIPALVAGVGLWLAIASPGGAAQERSSAAGQPRFVNFDFEMDGLTVSHWAIQIEQDGSGQYIDLSRSKQADTDRRPVRVGAATHRRLDAGFARVSAGNCDKNIKNLANTGTKKIAYRSAGDAWVSCTFTYTDDKGLMAAVSAFQAIAQMMQEGDQLEHNYRFDRLGLDAEMDELAREVTEGEAIEVENIAPVLKSIVEDERVMQRVRRKAARLLQDGAVLQPAQESAQ